MAKNRKTRQEKIITDLRKQVAVTTQTISYLPKNPLTEPTQPTKQAVSSVLNISDLKKDLLKTVLLSVLAISFELVLYFILG